MYRESSFLGTSPDGKSQCSCHSGKKIVGSEMSIFLKRNILTLIFFIDANKNLKKDHKYYAQVQCLLFLCNFEKCDLVVTHQWTPRWLHITEIEKDVQLMTNVLGTLQNFYIKNIFILSEVLTRKI